MKDRIKVINLEIKTLLKSKSNPEKLDSLQAELKELLIHKRLPPTLYKELSEQKRNTNHKPKSLYKIIKEAKMNDTKKQSRKTKKKSNLVDFQKEKSARDFSKSIENESLYEELKPKKVSKN